MGKVDNLIDKINFHGPVDQVCKFLVKKNSQMIVVLIWANIQIKKFNTVFYSTSDYLAKYKNHFTKFWHNVL